MARVKNRPGTNLAVVRARHSARIMHRPVAPRPDLPPSQAVATGPIRRSRAVPMTAAQRDSTGRHSHWNRSASYFDAVEVDRRWSK